MRHRPTVVSTPREFPRTVEEFLAELERRFPEPRANPSDTLADVMFRAGQRNVVLAMRDAFNKSRET